MVLMRVQYDAYNRQFKIVDGELARTLQDSETYMLIADISVQDLEMKESAHLPLSLSRGLVRNFGAIVGVTPGVVSNVG
jgi:hypothetical protein